MESPDPGQKTVSDRVTFTALRHGAGTNNQSQHVLVGASGSDEPLAAAQYTLAAALFEAGGAQPPVACSDLGNGRLLRTWKFDMMPRSSEMSSTVRQTMQKARQMLEEARKMGHLTTAQYDQAVTGLMAGMSLGLGRDLLATRAGTTVPAVPAASGDHYANYGDNGHEGRDEAPAPSPAPKKTTVSEADRRARGRPACARRRVMALGELQDRLEASRHTPGGAARSAASAETCKCGKRSEVVCQDCHTDGQALCAACDVETHRVRLCARRFCLVTRTDPEGNTAVAIHQLRLGQALPLQQDGAAPVMEKELVLLGEGLDAHRPLRRSLPLTPPHPPPPAERELPLQVRPCQDCGTWGRDTEATQKSTITAITTDGEHSWMPCWSPVRLPLPPAPHPLTTPRTLSPRLLQAPCNSRGPRT